MIKIHFSLLCHLTSVANCNFNVLTQERRRCPYTTEGEFGERYVAGRRVTHLEQRHVYITG